MCAAGSAIADSADFHVYLPGCAGFSSLRPTHDHPIWHPEPGAEWKIIKTPVRTLNYLLNEVDFPRLDVLSVDTEGTEIDVFLGFDLARWEPKCIVSESWNEHGLVYQYLTAFGYRHVERRSPNDFYLRQT
jgi:hypothetical protein